MSGIIDLGESSRNVLSLDVLYTMHQLLVSCSVIKNVVNCGLYVYVV